MSQQNITRERLDHLLRNWARWQHSERAGNGPRNEYMTMDRMYAWRPRGGTVAEHDETLGLHMEHAVLQLVQQQQMALVAWYCWGQDMIGVADHLGVSKMRAEAIYDTALFEVWRIIEGGSWAQ